MQAIATLDLHIESVTVFHITDLVDQDFVLFHYFDVTLFLHHGSLAIAFQPAFEAGIVFWFVPD